MFADVITGKYKADPWEDPEAAERETGAKPQQMKDIFKLNKAEAQQ